MNISSFKHVKRRKCIQRKERGLSECTVSNNLILSVTLNELAMEARESILFIMKTIPCNEDPLTPYFYIVKMGFTKVYVFFLFLL